MATSASPGVQSGPARSCLECRRLKRKCDRQLPCSECKTHQRSCEFDSVVRPKVTRQQLDAAEQKIARLEALLEQRTPGNDSLHALNSSPVGPSGMKRKSPSRTPTPDDSASALLSLSTGYEMPLGPVNTSQLASASSSGLLASMTPPFAWTPPSPRRPSKHMRQWSTSATAHSPVVPVAETSMPDKQPKNASGYEWNERSGGGGDGTGSLSIEPDGTGYLGFASGASLLRILQICAGGLSLSRINTPYPSPRLLPVSLSTWGGGEPSETEKNMYLDVYFQQYHPQYPLVHEPTFRAQWNEVVERPPERDWNFLSNIMVAIGAFCARNDTPQIADHFLNKATSMLGVDHLEAGTLLLVQAFTLLSNLTQKRNRLNAGSVYLGIAIRMAIGLGLHRELPLWRITPFERETRRRVWWVLYIFDSGACVTFGRPILLPQTEADVNLVLNITDSLLTARSRFAPESVEQPTVYSSLLYQSSLHLCANRCYTRVISSPSPSVLELLDLGRELEAWKHSLPTWLVRQESSLNFPWLAFTVQKLMWRYSNLKVIVFRRPFLERALRLAPLMPQVLSEEDASPTGSAELAGVAECLGSAQETIHSIHHFFSTHSAAQLEWWYGLHFLFHATFVPLIALHTDPSSASAESWRSDVSLAKATLRLLPGDALAKRCLSIINLLSPPSLQNVDSPTTYGQSAFGPLWTDPNFLANLGTTSDSQWFGDELRHTLLPFADLATLTALWPSG